MIGVFGIVLIVWAGAALFTLRERRISHRRTVALMELERVVGSVRQRIRTRQENLRDGH